MNEAKLRDFFLAKVTGRELAADLVGTVQQRSRDVRVVYIQDLPSDEEFTITVPMMVRLCDAVLAGELPAPALEPIAFAVVMSEHLHWDEKDEIVGRVLYDWASPEINWELTPENIQMFRLWLTGAVQPPPEPEVIDMVGGRILGHTEKAWVNREGNAEPQDGP